MSDPRMDHDGLVRHALANPESFRLQLRALLPAELLQRLDLDSLERTDSALTDAEARTGYADLVYTVRLAGPFPGRQALVYVLLEHKSADERWVVLQLLVYMVRLWKRHAEEHPDGPLAPIIPILFHHSPRGWKRATSFHSLFDPGTLAVSDLARWTPNFECLLDDISDASDQQLITRAVGAFQQLALFLLRDTRNPERLIRTLVAEKATLQTLWREPDGRKLVALLYRYIAAAADDETLDRFRTTIHTSLPETENIMTTIAEHWMQEGREKGLAEGVQQGLAEGVQQGLAEGVQQGLAEGKIAALLTILRARFGEPPEGVVSRISAADSKDLERWLELSAVAATLDELFS